jgi:tricorn protease-like protein
MSASAGPYFFVSYSRADTVRQQKFVSELRERGVNAWVDVEHLVPGSPAWEREIERSIRGAAGVIVLLSPDANNSQWVRREISFAEENDKRIFPVLVEGDENDSIPLRLSAHQRVDLRHSYNKGLDELANALKDHLGETLVGKTIKQKAAQPFNPADLRKFALPAVLVLIGVLCIGGIALAINVISNVSVPTATSTQDIVLKTTPTFTPAGPTDTPPPDYPAPTGKIVFTCGVSGDEVCIINPDGTGFHRLTDSYRSFNASLSPDGQKMVYVLDDGKNSEIYEMDLASGKAKQVTDLKKSVGSPEISPDNKYIIFHYRSGNNNVQLWIMNRDGSNPKKFYAESGKDIHDPTWSPDGTQILFAIGKNDSNKLYIMDLKNGVPKVVNDNIDTRGRSDWGINNLISFDQGGPFKHEVYVMDVDGSRLKQITSGSNAQGASISPDGNWIAFTAYTNVATQDQNSCEIFLMHLDGTDIRQLTNNQYCDYQPRWGN